MRAFKIRSITLVLCLAMFSTFSILQAWPLKEASSRSLINGTTAESSEHEKAIPKMTASLDQANVTSKCDSLDRIAAKLIVVAMHQEDITWLVRQVEVPFLAYQAENSSISGHQARVHNNQANEASAYLMFIAEYYDCLPEVMAFVHGHRSSWHSHDMVEDLQRLKWASVEGYMPLHVDYFQPYGMYFNAHLADPSKHLQSQLATGEAAHNVTAFDPGQVINGTAYKNDETYHYRQAQEIAHAWQAFFEPAGLGSMPEDVQYYCCGQFLVDINRIQRLPREFYLKAIHWTAHGSITGNFHPQFSRGLVFEVLWHYIFGEPAVMPKASHTRLCNHYTCDDE